MKIKTVDQHDRIFVAVELYYTREGKIRILKIEWEDGREFWVEDQKEPIPFDDWHMKEVYPVKIKGKWRYVYYQDPEFFVARKS